jgi:hypothetical protein
MRWGFNFPGLKMDFAVGAAGEEGVKLSGLENGLRGKRDSDKIYGLGCLCMRTCR